MTTKTIRVVIDTQVFLRAAINLKSLPAKVIFDLSDRYQLVVSEEIMTEIQEVLHRPKLRAKFPHLTDEIAEQIIQPLVSAEMTGISEVVAVSRDPKDDKFIACALAAQADYIVSEDNDLLVLNPYENIQIINVADFFAVLQTPSRTDEGAIPSGEQE